MPRMRSVFPSSVTTSRVCPESTIRRSAVSTSSDTSTVTTAGIGVITWRACCSCRWKTPESIPASPGSSLPPWALWAISSLRSSEELASSNSARGSTPTSRSIAFDAELSSQIRNQRLRLKSSSGRAVRRTVASACTIE